MKKIILLLALSAVLFACNRPSAADIRRAEKHQRDSIALTEQLRTLDYYQSQLDILVAQADSLLPLFKYEKNPKYQDYGYYVRVYNWNARVLVRDDGHQPVLVYKDGKRINNPDMTKYPEAQRLAILFADIREAEKRINRTSLEIEKFQKRLQKQ